MTSSGHFRSAIATGSPVVIPYFFAGMDFVHNNYLYASSDHRQYMQEYLLNLTVPASLFVLTPNERNALLTSI